MRTTGAAEMENRRNVEGGEGLTLARAAFLYGRFVWIEQAK